MGIIKHQHFKPLDTHDHSSTTEFSYLKKKNGSTTKICENQKRRGENDP
jgi:hypothetical protein